VSFSVLAQDLQDFVLTKSHEEGTLYHIKEVELDTDQSKTELVIDFTYLLTEEPDTVRILLTHASKEIKGKPDALSLIVGSEEMVWSGDQIRLLYVDRKKKYWESRVEILLAEEDFLKLASAGTYSIKWSSEGYACLATLPKKYRDEYQIFSELLKYN
jgi:hypothetical protein